MRTKLIFILLLTMCITTIYAEKTFQSINIILSDIPIAQAIDQVKKIKKEKIKVLKKFEEQIKVGRETLIKNYDEKINSSIDVRPKQETESEEQYNKRLEQNEQIKNELNREKANNVFEYNKKNLKSMQDSLAPFSKEESELLSKYYKNESNEKAILESVGKISDDKSYFTINIKYKEKTYNFDYRFRNVGQNSNSVTNLSLDTVKVMLDTPKLFIIEPFYRIDSSEIVSKLACFRVKHMGTGVKTDFLVTNENTNFSDYFTSADAKTIPYEVYLNLLFIDKLCLSPCIKQETLTKLKLIDILLKDKYFDEFKNIIDENNAIVKIAVSPCHSVGLKADGTVVACGLNQNNQCDVKPLNFYIYDIAVNEFDTIGLSLDCKQLRYCGWNGLRDITNQNVWKNIVCLKLGKMHAVGLKEDGTVVACGDNSKGQCNVSDWRNIVSISAGDNHTIGLKNDGTVVACGDNSVGQCDVQTWTDIKSIETKLNVTAAIKADGTVVACGDNSVGQCNTEDWQNVVDLSIGYVNIAGLKNDGTVIISGDNSQKQCDVKDWKDIVKIELGNYYTIGLKKDGSVVAIGWNKYGQCNTTDWKDIVDISVSYGHVLGLSKNGTIVATGWNEYGQCNVIELNEQK